MRKGRFFVGFFCFLTGVGLLAAGCGNGSSKKTEFGENTTQIQVGETEHNPAYAPFYVALEEGYFEQEGINIKLTDVGSELDLQKKLLSGECDIGILGSANSILSCEESERNQIVSLALLTVRAEPVVLAREPVTKITSKTISGANVLMQDCESQELVFRYILEKNGISSGDLGIERLADSKTIMDSFRNGEGDFALLPKNLALELEKQQEGYRIMDMGKASGHLPYSSFCVGREYSENHKQILLAYKKALQHGMDFVSEHSEEEIAEKISEMFPKTDKKELVKIIKEYKSIGIWKENTVFEKTEFALMQNILMDFGKMNEPVAYEQICMTEDLEK